MTSIKKWFGRAAWALVAMHIGAAASNAPAHAETLESALTDVYDNSPTLNAERARLRATDEELAKAQSGYRPNISVDADYGVGSQLTGVKDPTLASGLAPTRGQIDQNAAGYKRYDGETHPGGFAVSLSQPIFEGFRTLNSVKAADASILAARESLRDVEQRTLLDAIKAYMDVLRDAAAMTLRQHSLQLLSSEANATQERFAVGASTRTDVAQARSREAEARAALEMAKATLRGSLANYQRLVGHVPTKLTDPVGFEQHLPARIENAIDAAVSRNPQVLGAAYMEKASAYEVTKTLGEMLPQARLQAAHSERFDPSTVLSQQINESASVRVNIPLYQSGEVEARVRQAKQQHQGRLQEIQGARDMARSEAISAFAQIQAIRAQVAAIRQQVASTTESLAGVREEQRAGQRTLLDVLNAEQEQTNAKVAAVNARHDLVVAAYSLLSAMGQLTAADLGLGVQLYDVRKHYAQTNGRWSGTTIDREKAVAGEQSAWAATTKGQE